MLNPAVKVVNGAGPHSVVDALFRAGDPGSGRTVDTAAELDSLDEQALLDAPTGLARLGERGKSRQPKANTQLAPLLPPDCQGMACQAKHALAEFAAACAANRSCQKILAGQVQGQET